MNVEVPRKYVLGEFELEPDKYLLKRNGERVHLPELPFQGCSISLKIANGMSADRNCSIGFGPGAKVMRKR